MDDKVEAQMSKSKAIHIPNPVLSAMFCMIWERNHLGMLQWS